MPLKPLRQATKSGRSLRSRSDRELISYRTGLALWTIVLALASCATVTRGANETFAIHSEPTGASVRSSTGWSCVTPCSINIGRKSSFALDLEKLGYERVRVMVRAEMDNAGRTGLAGNIVFGGLIGAAIDGGSGSMYSHPENPLLITLREEQE